jgi:Tol biopolymer transport system component
MIHSVRQAALTGSVVCAAIVAVAAGAAPAPLPRIAYVKAGGGCAGHGADHLAVFASGRVRTITKDCRDAQSPSWSLDGKMIVFARASERLLPPDAIWTIRADGSHARRIRPTEGVIGTPRFSPDGSHIAYDVYYYKYDDYPTIEVVPSTVTDQRGNARVVDLMEVPSKGTPWDWSPDGRSLVVGGTPYDDSTRDRAGIYTVDVATHARRLVVADAHQPAWSARGWIAFVGRRGLEVIRPDGSGRRLLVRGCELECRFALSDPAWSRRGDRLAYVRWDRSAGSEGSTLYVVSLARGKPKRLASFARASSLGRPSWSRDGRTLVVNPDFRGIYAVPSNGSAADILVVNGTLPDAR